MNEQELHDVLTTTKGRYLAVYARHHSLYADGYETPEDAADHLNYDEEYGRIYATGIYDTERKEWMAQAYDDTLPNYIDGYLGERWAKAIALEA